MGTMSRRWQIALFWTVAVAGVALHCVFWLRKTGMHYPDEIFQYIEPAFVRLKGFGWLPWEFNRGVRNWSLIAYYGGWMKLFMAFGADGAWLHRLIGLHNTLLALAVFPAALRLGRLYGGETGGWTAAVLTAVLPPVVFFTPHPLSEVPSMVLSTWGIVFWLEGRGREDERRHAFLAGMLIGLSVVVRFFSAVFVLVPFFDYAARLLRRKGGMLYYMLGGLVAVALLGVSDWLTWGRPFHSALEYFRYNILEWGNADHGVSPWWQYLLWLLQRINWGLAVFIPVLLIGAWRTKLLFVTSLLALASLSFIAHKEERFILGIWPLLLITFSAGVAQVGRWSRYRGRVWIDAAAASFLSAVLLVSTSLGTAKLEWHWLGSLFKAQEFVGKHNDVSGCMFEGRLHLSGGSSYINKNVPMDSYQVRLSRNPLFNYFIFLDDSVEARFARTKKWVELARIDDVVVFRRP
jgi:phosphatidylinositol glycan class B